MKIIWFVLILCSLIDTPLFSQLPGYIPQAGLAGYWQFNGNANDLSGGGNNGIVTGSVATISKNGQVGNAYYFDGIDDYIQFPNPMLGGQQVSSFSLFFRFKKENSNYMNLWGKSLFWGEVYVELKNDNSISIFWANSNGGNRYSNGWTGPNVISPSVWYDVVITFQNSNIKIYINGQEKFTNLAWVAQGGSVLSTTQVGSMCNFAQDLGSHKIAPASTFKGVIDEMGVWNRALFQTEIFALFSPGDICATPSRVPF